MNIIESLSYDLTFNCRLCLAKNDRNIPILSRDGQKNDIQKKISALFSITVREEDYLPKCICHQCWNYLDIIYKFMDRVKEAQLRILSLNVPLENTTSNNLEKNLPQQPDNHYICPEIDSYQSSISDESGNHGSVLDLVEVVEEPPINSTDQDNTANNLSQSQTDFTLESNKEEVPSKSKKRLKIRKKTEVTSIKNRKEKPSWDPKMDEEIEKFYEFFCELCTADSKFETFNLLCKHYKNEHSIEGYLKCCKRKMYCKSHLYNHLILHTRPELYKCPECDKQLCSPVNLKQHFQLFHRPETELPYRCSMCDRGFATKAAVENHEKSQHILSEEEKFAHICDVCGKRFSSAPGVLEHKKQVHAKIKPLLCDICAKAFPNRSRLRKHMTSHNDSENLKCPHCDKRLKNYGRLQVHLKYHQGVVHSCPHCDKTYPTRRLIQRHIKTHSDERPYSCSVCGKRYRESSHLKMHFNQHTGELPYSCQWCPKRFSASGPFYTHRKKAHPEELARVEGTLC